MLLIMMLFRCSYYSPAAEGASILMPMMLESCYDRNMMLLLMLPAAVYSWVLLSS